MSEDTHGKNCDCGCQDNDDEATVTLTLDDGSELDVRCFIYFPCGGKSVYRSDPIRSGGQRGLAMFISTVSRNLTTERFSLTTLLMTKSMRSYADAFR